MPLSPSLHQQAAHLTLQLWNQINLQITSEEATAMVAALHDQRSWDQLLALDEAQPLEQDIPLQTERLVKRLKKTHGRTINNQQAISLLMTKAALPMTKKAEAARIWRFDTTNERCEWLLFTYLERPEQDVPPLLVVEMDYIEIPGLKRKEYLLALAGLSFCTTAAALKDFEKALNHGAKIIKKEGFGDTIYNLLSGTYTYLSEIMDEVPKHFEKFVDEELFSGEDMELWMLKKAYRRHKLVKLDVYADTEFADAESDDLDEDSALGLVHAFSVLIPRDELPKGSRPDYAEDANVLPETLPGIGGPIPMPQPPYGPETDPLVSRHAYLKDGALIFLTAICELLEAQEYRIEGFKPAEEYGYDGFGVPTMGRELWKDGHPVAALFYTVKWHLKMIDPGFAPQVETDLRAAQEELRRRFAGSETGSPPSRGPGSHDT